MQASSAALVLPSLPPSLQGRGQAMVPISSASKITRLARINTRTHRIQGVVWEAAEALVAGVVVVVAAEVEIAATGIAVGGQEASTRIILPQIRMRRPRRTNGARTAAGAGAGAGTATIRPSRGGSPVRSLRKSR